MAQVERHAVPPPVVDPQPRRDERLGLALGIHALFLSVALVLGTHGFGGIDGADRAQHLGRLVAEGLGVQGTRGFHGQERQHLQHVVLEQVADRARPLVVGGTASDVDVLGDRDLHVLDRVAVPDPFPQRIREPEHHQVLHRLLAQVVIDAEELSSLNASWIVSVSARDDSRECPNGFSTTMPEPGVLAPMSPMAFEITGNAPEGTAR